MEEDDGCLSIKGPPTMFIPLKGERRKEKQEDFDTLLQKKKSNKSLKKRRFFFESIKILWVFIHCFGFYIAKIVKKIARKPMFLYLSAVVTFDFYPIIVRHFNVWQRFDGFLRIEIEWKKRHN